MGFRFRKTLRLVSGAKEGAVAPSTPAASRHARHRHAALPGSGVVFHSKQGGGRQVAPGAAQPGGWETPGWIGVKYGLIAWFVSTMLMTVVALVINQRGLLATMPKLSLVLAVVVGVLAMRKAKRANQALLSAAPANDARACAADEDSRR